MIEIFDIQRPGQESIKIPTLPSRKSKNGQKGKKEDIVWLARLNANSPFVQGSFHVLTLVQTILGSTQLDHLVNPLVFTRKPATSYASSWPVFKAALRRFVYYPLAFLHWSHKAKHR